MTSPEDIATAYWEHYRRSFSDERDVRRSADECFWAVEVIEARMREDADSVVALLVEVADAAPDDRALAYLGAGPVEDLLRRHGGRVVYDRVVGWATRNERFLTAVRCAWIDDHVPADVARRLHALGPPR